ncbi:MAG: uracil-DNA glycosylase [Syntrophomonadaceae bacterium]|nr:uracil-DNA glycosylase [Syntrophomonadaceae bacterium]
MTKEQPSLFGNISLFEEVSSESPVKHVHFLPGLKEDEGYDHIGSWEELEDTARSCRRCPLRDGCKQVVFGTGSTDADIMLVGEGPGQSEDEMGIPFVGRAGQLLDRILEAAGINRPNVYITNVVKCRPPGNRLPNPHEIAVCRGFLEAQIRLLKPKMIICLGALATQTVVDNKAKITLVRGRWFTRQGIMIMPTYHPAALLRNESLKRPVWEDFKLIRQEIIDKGLKK